MSAPRDKRPTPTIQYPLSDLNQGTPAVSSLSRLVGALASPARPITTCSTPSRHRPRLTPKPKSEPLYRSPDEVDDLANRFGNVKLSSRTEPNSPSRSKEEPAKPWSPSTQALILSLRKPPGFAPDQELFNFQNEGRRWIVNRITGAWKSCLLADEMGLGKTIQKSAVILDVIAILGVPSYPPFLIVVPSSILGQWAQQLKKFAPGLRVLIYHGSGRPKDPAKLAGYDVALTTYGTVTSEYKSHTGEQMGGWTTLCDLGRFSGLVLDEANAIQNAGTKTATACRAFDASWRIAVTATPIQNGIENGYSLIDFLNPPPFVYDKHLRDGSREQLHHILWNGGIMKRRTKKDVENDPGVPRLTEKSSQDILCSMDESQRDYYASIEKASHLYCSKTGSMKKVHIYLRLLRLMQAAIHPNLLPHDIFGDNIVCKACRKDLVPEDFDDDSMPGYCSDCQEIALDSDQPRKATAPVPISYKPLSSKFKAAIKLVKECPKGDKMLIVSRFTSVLDAFGELVKDEGFYAVQYDGRMTLRERERALSQFERSPTYRFALVSLKAGGVGLNLTMANHVVLMEPWWNPAVEDQAIDRVHRFGQTKTVYVYRLMVPDSVDGKIREVQNNKRDTMEEVLTAEAPGILADLTEDEILSMTRPSESSLY